MADFSELKNFFLERKRRNIREMTSEENIKVTKLNNENYRPWAFKMKMLLDMKECGEVISEARPENPSSSWLKKAQKALQIISLNIEDNQVVFIKNCNDGREAWDNLKDIYKKDDSAAQIRTMKQLFKTNLCVGGSMREHLVKIADLIDQLREMSIVMPESIIAGIILASLNEEYEAVITGIEAWDISRLKFSNVRAKLMEEYEKKSKGNQGQVNATPEGAARAKSKNEFLCYGCGKPGHIKRNCPDLRTKLKRMRNENVSNNDDDNKASSAKAQRYAGWYKSFSMKEDDDLFSGWIVDSGATSHMCNNKNEFKKIDLNHRGGVIVANGERIEAMGIGEVEIVLNSRRGGYPVTLSNVLWVPKLDGNLVSVRKLTEKGFKVEFKGKICTLKDNGGDNECLLIGKYEGGLYKLLAEETCFKVTGEPEERCIHEWHKAMAHRNLMDIRSIERRGLRISKCNCSDECESCIRGKMQRKSFPKKATPTKNVMDCVVSDICGPMQVESVGRRRYFITFIDIHSKYTEVKVLREKSEAADSVIEYIERMKTQVGKKPKVFRTDRGTEYLNAKLQGYLRKEGIKFQCTVGYAPEQNGVAERMNRTLVESVRTMLIDSGLPKRLWAEAVLTAAYTMNCIPGKNKERSPYETVFNKKPTFAELHEFGCDVYVMIPYEKRRKLDDKAEKMKFVGYDSASKGYRLMDKNFRIVVSREVHFLKSKQSWKKEMKDDTPGMKQCGEIIVNLEHGFEDGVQEYEEYHYDHFQEEEDDLMEGHDGNVEEEMQHDIEHVQDDEVQEEMADDYVQDENDHYDNIEEEHMEVQDEPQQEVPVRRSERMNAGRLPERFNDYMLYEVRNDSEMFEPRTYDEAIKCKFAEEWINAMKEEINSIEENQTWNLVELPTGRKAIGSKWVFKLKLDEKGNIIRRKARLVAQGFSQKYGVDYDEVFAPVVRGSTFRLLLSVSGVQGYKVKHYDIKTAFLNGNLDEDIYMKQPKGFENGQKVYKLKKSLYGLKQAARVWNQTLHKELIKNGCKQGEVDKCLYILNRNNEIVYLLVHVDDMLVAYNSENLMNGLMELVGKAFEMKDLGEVKSFLEIDVEKNVNGHYMISQPRYIEKVLKESGLKDAKESKHPLDTGYWKLSDEDNMLDSNEVYRKLIGMLLYLSTNTRPDIAAAVSILSQRVSSPRQVDINEVKRVIRYLKGTKELKLSLSSDDAGEVLFGYSDANWAEDRVDRKSNSGYLCKVNGGTISWSCRKQDIVSLSSTEAEFVALSETCKEINWLRRISKEMKINLPKATKILTDSQSAMSMINNQKFSNRTKHIDTKYHFIRDKVMTKEVELEYVSTEKNVADMLTKPLGATRIRQLREMAGMKAI